MVLMGQPDYGTATMDNPIVVNDVLSFLIYGTTQGRSERTGPVSKRPMAHDCRCFFYTYHIMAGLGRYFIAVMTKSVAFLLWRSKLYGDSVDALGCAVVPALCLTLPTRPGRMTAEIRPTSPGSYFGLMRTAEGYSKYVHAGNTLFTLLGFMGLYAVLAILFLFLVHRIIARGPLEEADTTYRQACR